MNILELNKIEKPLKSYDLRGFDCLWKALVSGWQDSNLRPPAPKAGAITELRYTPNAAANIGLFFTPAKFFNKDITKPVHQF